MPLCQSCGRARSRAAIELVTWLRNTSDDISSLPQAIPVIVFNQHAVHSRSGTDFPSLQNQHLWLEYLVFMTFSRHRMLVEGQGSAGCFILERILALRSKRAHTNTYTKMSHLVTSTTL